MVGINYDEELEKILGDKYEGCTQAGDELIEYRLKPGYTLTSDEEKQLKDLYKGSRSEITKIKSEISELHGLEARVSALEQTLL